jgi:hypothetical protein
MVFVITSVPEYVASCHFIMSNVNVRVVEADKKKNAKSKVKIGVIYGS